jgi:hypothetical protein
MNWYAGLVWYSLMDNLRKPCCHGVIPNTAHGCNESLAPEVAEANIRRLEGFAKQFMKHEELLVGETVSGAAVGWVIDPCPVNPCHNHTHSTAWPRVQHVVKRPRGVATGSNSTPTTLVIVNAMNSTMKTGWSIDVGGARHNLTIALGPHTVHFAPL